MVTPEMRHAAIVEAIATMIESNARMWGSRDQVYVGITNDVVRRFNEHNAPPYQRYYQRTGSERLARDAEELLLSRGYAGGGGGGDGRSLYIYAYLITPGVTNE